MEDDILETMEPEQEPVLTKRERKALRKQEKLEGREKAERQGRLVKTVIALLVIALLGGGGWWIWKEATKPLPGEEVADLGREHVSEGTQVEYNSNPPTSGPHYANWIRATVSDTPLPDGNLIHSLEHGYVIMSYNCSEGDECEKLKNNLKSVYEKKGQNKLIVVPRPNLDSLIALTAWNRIQKLQEYDEQAIVNFIDSFRNRGPEKTME